MIAFIVTGLVTLSYDPSKLLVVTILFLIIHVLEGYVLTPLVQKRAVYLPPALTILAQVLMSMLFGFLGLILATPLAAALRVIVTRLYLEPRSEAVDALRHRG
ncbi:MAG: AI-2E family transporter [Acidobacteriota bacterium]|nr:AI-2E family transporter [Acidobacteriota bacterium]